MNLEEFAKELTELEAVRFGRFTLKSGLSSPFYLDLRRLLADPESMERTAGLLAEKAAELEFDVIAGIPYTAVPLASLVAVKLGKPLVIPRKEVKTYGTGGAVVGTYKQGDTCLVLDDLITTGGSKLETAELLEKEGLTVKEFLVVIDRRGDRKDELEERGYRLTSLYTLPDLLTSLTRQNLLSNEQAEEIRLWMQNNNAGSTSASGSSRPAGTAASPAVAAASAVPTEPNPLNNRLLSLMEAKQSNLVLSLDVTGRRDFFRILEQVEDRIVMLKTHVDILDDFDASFTEELKERAGRKGFLLFEDRKFADIGNTVRHQYRDGIYRIHDWSDFVSVHLIAGGGTLEGLFTGTENRAGFLLARMSSKGNLITPDYTEKVLEAGRKHPEWVCGYIGHGRDAADIRTLKQQIPGNQLLLMPGVQLSAGGDALGQQYLSVEEAVEGGADLLIVGRGLYGSEDPRTSSEQYRSRGWKALKERIKREGK